MAKPLPPPPPPPPWPVRAVWWAWGWLIYWPQTRQLKREGFKRTGWREWEYHPDA